MHTVYLGIDNGVSGSLAISTPNQTFFFKTPIFTQQNYTKKQANISRINTPVLGNLIETTIAPSTIGPEKIMAIIERPMVNPGRFKATVSAVRSLEAVLIVLESFQIAYIYCDSKEWQREFLPKDCHKDNLKSASRDIGIRLFPGYKAQIEKHGDADSLLMMEWARRKNL